MGASLGGLCGSDIFQELKKKYGQQFVKLIIAQKAKDAIRTRFGQVGGQLEGIFNEGRLTTTNMVTEKTNYVTGLFNQLKQTLNSKIPGGISMVEQFKGEPIQQIVGFNKLIMVVNQIQNKALTEMSNKQGVVTQELRTRQQNFIQTINDQKPQLPLYDQLPQAIQTQILHKGQEVFMSQVQSRQAQMMTQIDNQISVDKVKDLITQLIPSQQLNNVAGNAQTNFSSVLSSLLSGGIGGSSGGGVGGVVNMIGGLFGGSNNNNVNNSNNNNNALNNLTNNIPFLNFGNNSNAQSNAQMNANNSSNQNSNQGGGGIGAFMNNIFN